MRIKLPAIAGLSIVGSALCSSVSAQSDDPVIASLAAGYKAAFTCSAHFNAGRTVEQIAGDELHRVYPALREALAALPPAQIDEKKKTVSVVYADNKPARVSAWRPFLGCAQLPTLGDPKLVKKLPVVRGTKPIIPSTLSVSLSDAPELAATVSAAFDKATYGEGTETTAVLIMKNGEIIAEKYRDGFGPDVSQRTWSVAKSIAATVMGAAVHQGIIDTDDYAGLKQWSSKGDPRGEIKVDDLLRMASGLTSPTAGNRTDDVYAGGGRVVDHAITNRLVAEPGALWRYANNDTMAAVRSLREKMDDDAFLRFPFEAVLRPAGHGEYVSGNRLEWRLYFFKSGVDNGARFGPARTVVPQ